MNIIEIPEGETVAITSPNIVEVYRNGRLFGELWKDQAEAVYLKAKEGTTYVMTDRLPPEGW